VVIADDLQKKPVILVVDDEPLLRLVLCEHLMGCGFHTLEAFDAPNAIEIIESGVEIDAVLTDVKMPGEMDGVGLAKWIRENRPALAVFVATAYSGKIDLARELCASEHVFSKPYDFDFLAAKIREHLETRRGAKH